MAISPTQKRRELYADFRKDLLANPVSLDLARNTNEEAVKDSIKNLIKTNRGERFFRPTLGSNLRAMLFENISELTVLTIQEMVREVIETYEPRANIIEILATPNDLGNEVNLRITFNVVNSEQEIVLITTLTRVR